MNEYINIRIFYTQGVSKIDDFLVHTYKQKAVGELQVSLNTSLFLSLSIYCIYAIANEGFSVNC